VTPAPLRHTRTAVRTLRDCLLAVEYIGRIFRVTDGRTDRSTYVNDPEYFDCILCTAPNVMGK
jgi:hypothetical protein